MTPADKLAMTGPQWRNRRILRGFSLVELIMVVLIVSIVASIAIPRFASTLALQRVEAAANRIQRDLEFARRYARQSSAELTVAFDQATHSYHLIGVSDPNHPAQEYVIELGEEPYQVQILAVDFDGNAKVTFDGFGAPNAGGKVEIETSGFKATVSVSKETGRPSRG